MSILSTAQAATFEKIQLYIVSLWLLFVLVIVITIDIPICLDRDCVFIGYANLIKMNIPGCVSLVFLMLGALFALTFNCRLDGGLRLPTKVSAVENINFEHLTFLVAYIVPLVGMDLTKPKYLVVVSLLLIFIGAIYVRTGMFYSNPSLALLGYHIYKAKGSFDGIGRDVSVVIITKDRLRTEDMIFYKCLDDKIVFGRRAE